MINPFSKKTDISLPINVALLISCVLLCTSSCDSTTQLKKGDRFGNSMLLTLDHNRYYLNEQNQQTGIFIFWATWCTVCKKEMIALNKHYEHLQNKQVKIMAVCFNPEEIDKVKNIVSHLDIKYPILLDEGAKLYNRFQTGSAPLTVLVDKNGQIDRIVEGYNEQILRKMIARVEILLETNE